MNAILSYNFTFWQFFMLVTAFSFLYSFIDAWHDEKVINRETSKWHFVDSIMKFFVYVSLLVTSTITLSFAFTGWLFFLLLVHIIFVRATTFDFMLNILRMLPLNHRGKNPIDQVPWWIKLIALIVNLLIIILIFDVS